MSSSAWSSVGRCRCLPGRASPAAMHKPTQPTQSAVDANAGAPDAPASALQWAQAVSVAAAAQGFDWPDVHGPIAKVDEEVAEVKQALLEYQQAPAPARAAAKEALAGELGDVLFSLVNVCRHLQLQAEDALQQTTARFLQRFAHMQDNDKRPEQGPQTLAQWQLLWQEAKRAEGQALSAPRLVP